MMKSIVLASLLASAAAFAPNAVVQTTSSTSLSAFAKGYLGNDGPEPMFIGESGSKNFDPAGFCEVRGRKAMIECKLCLLEFRAR